MFKYFRVIFFIIPSIIYEYFRWILPYSINPRKYSFEKRFLLVQKIVRKVLVLFNVRWFVHDRINFDSVKDNSKSTLYICNHISFIDPLFIISIAKKPITFVAKKETKKMVLVGRIIRVLEGEFLDREDLKQELKVFMRVQERMKNENIDFIIFPEGTRSKNNELNTFHHGTFRPAFKIGNPIILSAISGSNRVLDSKDKNKYYPIDFSIIDYIKKDDYQGLTTKDLAVESENKVKQELIKLNTINTKHLKELNSK